MNAITRNDYEKVIKSLNISMDSEEKCIDVYHKNNWDRFTMHFCEETENKCPSYIDFFFDAKEMVDFLKTFIEKGKFEKCYVASRYNGRYKLKFIDDDVCKDIYDEFKKLLNSLGLKINTCCAIEMDKTEILNWCDRISIGAFSGVSEYVIVIPELEIIINPHHHMNYLIYSNNTEELFTKIAVDISGEIACYY